MSLEQIYVSLLDEQVDVRLSPDPPPDIMAASRPESRAWSAAATSEVAMPAHLLKCILVLAIALAGAAACGRKEPPPKRKMRSGVTAPARTDPAKGTTPEPAKEPEKAPEPSGPEPPADSVAALERNYDRAKAAFKQHQSERTQASYDRAKSLLLAAKDVADKLEAAGKAEAENVVYIISDVNYLLRTLPDYPPE